MHLQHFLRLLLPGIIYGVWFLVFGVWGLKIKVLE